MKKIILAAITTTFAITSVFVADVAFAGSGSGSNGVGAKMTGKNATSYADGYFGDVTCNETHHPKFDTVSCRIATPNLALAGTTGTVGWNSDFAGGGSGTLSYTVSVDGSSYTGQATY